MLYVDDEIFGPARRMWRPKAERTQWAWIRSKGARYARSKLKYRRVKWLWCAQHLKQRSSHKTEASNRHFIRQRDRMVALIRPDHLRRKLNQH